MSEPANFFHSLAGVPVLYDRLQPSDYGVRGVTHEFHVPPDFQQKLERGFQDLWTICPLGPAQTILSAGTYSDRPPSQHALGRAMDIDAILWPQRRFVTLDFPTDKMFYLAVESVLRRNFDFVLTYLYNDDHHDHFHVDLAGRIGFGRSRSKMLYVQAYCRYVLGLPVGVDGTWGPNTEEGLSRAQEILQVPGDLEDGDRWKEFLFAAATHGFEQALRVSDDDPHHADVVALNNAIEEGMTDHPLRKFALERVATLHNRLRKSTTAAAVAQPPGIPNEIIQIAAKSEIAGFEWPGRGQAPLGYTKGMALVFARTYCRLKAGDRFATEMAIADTGDPERDALTWYREIFDSLGMDNSVAGVDTLRHLFVLMMGLGMRESSGNYCEGRDTSAHNTTSETAEAGLFQTSFNARSGSPLLVDLFGLYKANPVSAFLDVFKEGADCDASDFENFGKGDGREYQRLAKAIPEFHTEFTAIAMRHVGGGGDLGHWGPIKSRKAKVIRKCDEMFKQVQDAVDASNLCPVFA